MYANSRGNAFCDDVSIPNALYLMLAAKNCNKMNVKKFMANLMATANSYYLPSTAQQTKHVISIFGVRFIFCLIVLS